MIRSVYPILLALVVTISANASIKPFTTGMDAIHIVNDTVYSSNNPICLIGVKDSVTTVSTFFRYDIITLTTFHNSTGKYFAVNFLPTSETYYAKQTEHFLHTFLAAMTRTGVIEDNYFSYTGADKLIAELKNKQLLIDGNKRGQNQNEVLNWQIGWRNTDNPDSMLMLADKKPFAYYKYRHWQDYGVERFDRLQKTGELYAYFLYDFDNKPLATISVILSNDASTLVKVTTWDKKEYYFKNVPKERHLLLVAAKLILAKQVLDKK
ncbi:MAG: hypothetical protein H6551_10525 [Chitinophagales bacterium]|nr:hypothetical protein [Chitinophagaceae bacterium]MCB9065563.1 hypothetical protein [Chitinophagales bacterium]